jgi:hypothetical protein
MSNYPNAIDDASSLYSPADAFSAKPLETITTMPVYAGDTTISVESTGVGFPDEYGILSIDDELIVYTGKTATQFTGCQRGACGRRHRARQHGLGLHQGSPGSRRCDRAGTWGLIRPQLRA